MSLQPRPISKTSRQIFYALRSEEDDPKLYINATTKLVGIFEPVVWLHALSGIVLYEHYCTYDRHSTCIGFLFTWPDLSIESRQTGQVPSVTGFRRPCCSVRLPDPSQTFQPFCKPQVKSCAYIRQYFHRSLEATDRQTLFRTVIRRAIQEHILCPHLLVCEILCGPST